MYNVIIMYKNHDHFYVEMPKEDNEIIKIQP